jgi:uncharacterized membrane protein
MPPAPRGFARHSSTTGVTIDELTARNVESVVRIEAEAHAKRTLSDGLADLITGFCGSMSFVWTHVVWFGIWIAFNTMPELEHFDPFPFPFLTLVVSLEAIFLSTFILISENRQSRIGDRRNLLDLQINLLAEQENTKMLKLLAQIAKKVGANIEDAEIRALEAPTHPDHLADQIERTMTTVENEAEAAKKLGTPAADRKAS